MQRKLNIEEFRPPELMLIVNCSRLFQRQALLAAILLLAEVLSTHCFINFPIA